MSKDQDEKNLQMAGICMMILAGIGTCEVIYGMINPSIYSNAALGSWTVNGSTLDRGSVVMIVSVLGIVLSAIELLFGLLGYKLRVNGAMAKICLVVGVITLIAGIGQLVSEGFRSGVGLTISDGLIAILYYVYFKKLPSTTR